MQGMLFRLLTQEDLQPGHPDILAMMYAYCPAAARWWLSGVQPVLPFDPVWSALELRSSGKTLREVLDEWELSVLVETARSYVERIEAYRSKDDLKNFTSPELLPTFHGSHIQFENRYRNSEAFKKIGGWENFLPFVRAWAFILEDWRRNVRLTQETFYLCKVPVRIQSNAVFWVPIWMISGRNQAYRLFLVENIDKKMDALLAECVLHFEEGGCADTYLKADPFGRVDRLQVELEHMVLQDALEKLFRLGMSGPYPPLVGLKYPGRCQRCGFYPVCWLPSDHTRSGLSPLAMKF